MEIVTKMPGDPDEGLELRDEIKVIIQYITLVFGVKYYALLYNSIFLCYAIQDK
jgi:hypothetical protein